MTRNSETHYSDLLAQSSDAQTYTLVQDLHRVHSNIPTPPANMNWESLMTQYRKEQRTRLTPIPSQRRRPIPRFAIGLAAALLLLIATVITSATVLGDSSLLRTILGMTNGGVALLDNGQFTQLHQNKTVNGIRINLDSGYADANAIIIGMTTNNNESVLLSKLTTRQGQTIPILMERGTATNSKKESATSTMYDASSITGAPQRLDLTLEVTLTNGGNAAFDFSLPFHPGQILTPQITSTSKGATLTLEKVLLAPSGSLITIKGLDDPGPLDAMLKAPDGHITGFLHYGMRDSKAIFSFSEKAPVANQPGRWTLTLSRTPVANDPNEDPHLIPRTWTFVFIVP